MNVLQSVLWFIIALGILVTVHEFGHYWVARRCGIRILRFSVGFGNALWRRRFGPDGTEFVIAMVPLGGYVKMLDEREGEVAPAELSRAFNRQSLGVRTAVVAAGPLFNLVFAVLAYSVMYMVGMTGPRPIVEEVTVGGLAYQGGLRAGDEVVAIDGQATPTWDRLLQDIVEHVLNGEAATLEVVGSSAVARRIQLPFDQLSVDGISEGRVFQELGLKPLRQKLTPRVIEIEAGSPAANGGLRSGDTILSADGQPFDDWRDWVDYVQARPDVGMQVEVRDGDGARRTLTITPAQVTEGDKTFGRIGAGVDLTAVGPMPPMGVERFGPLAALGKGVSQTGSMIGMSLQIIGKIVTGQASVKNLRGPIGIAEFAGQSAAMGLAYYISFLGMISISLGVLNLLPVPLLDGGHLLYYLIEFVTRRPVPEGTQIVGQQIGLVLLLGLMGFVIFNDLMRII